MERVDIESLSSDHPASTGVDRRGLTEPLGASDLALNYYALDPGDAFSGGVHAHLDQEEVFYVMTGEATFEVHPDPDADPETVTVGAGEAIRFAPGEFQQGRNEADEPLTALALGAPRPSTAVRVPEACRTCGESDTMAVTMPEGQVVLECPECGETVPVDR